MDLDLPGLSNVGYGRLKISPITTKTLPKTGTRLNKFVY